MRCKFSTLLFLSTCFFVGCNKDDDSNTSVPDAPTTQAVNPVLGQATTQELLSSPRTPLNIMFVPITLQVPPGWEVKTYSDGSIRTIEGQTPTGVIGISIPTYSTISPEQEKSLESHAKKDFLLHPDLMQSVGVKDITGGKVIEQLTINAPTTQIDGTPIDQPIQTVLWTFTLCVPTSDGKDFNAYELRYLGLTLKQFKADQDFLRSIMDTLTYTPLNTDTLIK